MASKKRKFQKEIPKSLEKVVHSCSTDKMF